MSLPEFSDLKKLINWEKVAKQIATPEECEKLLSADDFKEAKKLVWLAAETWLPRDYVEFNIHGVEEKYEVLLKDCKRNVKGYFDLRGTINGISRPFKPYKGRHFILDWKTSRNTLDQTWKDRLVGSWQHLIYAWQYNEKFGIIPSVIYRGISRNQDTREILMEIRPVDIEETERYLKQAANIITLLEPEEVWFMNKPYSCNAYGKECIRLVDCEDFSMPRRLIDKGQAMSYTGIKLLGLCPERYRRDKLDAEDQKVKSDSEESLLGKGIHRGLAEIWRQIFQKN